MEIFSAQTAWCAALAQQGAAQASASMTMLSEAEIIDALRKEFDLSEFTSRPQGGGDKDSSENIAAQAAHAGADTERDAARYRWLRDPTNKDATRIAAQYSREPLDRAIDAAIAASQPLKGSEA